MLTEQQQDGLIEALREIEANAYFFYLDNTDMHPAHRELFIHIKDRATAALKEVGAHDPNTVSAQWDKARETKP